jgi:hypothetical protein
MKGDVLGPRHERARSLMSRVILTAKDAEEAVRSVLANRKDYQIVRPARVIELIEIP